MKLFPDSKSSFIWKEISQLFHGSRALFSVVVFFVLIIGTARPLFSQIEWTKDSNPLPLNGASGTWNRNVFMPCVLYNPDSSRYEMWFAAGFNHLRPYRIGFATSTDRITWNVYPNPVLEPDLGSWDESTVEDPMVLRENGGQYKMWYTGWSPSNLPGKIGYATSPDGITWTKYPNNPVLEGTAAWEPGGPTSGTVMADPGGGYKMWYAGWNAAYTSAKIGYATSPDGITWTKDPNNPVLGPGTTGEWDDAWICQPGVFILNGMYYMLYSSEYSGGNPHPRRIGLATSQDGIIWTKYDDPGTTGPPFSQSDPVLSPSPGQWDQHFVEGPFTLLIDGTLHTWYNGSTDPTDINLWRIGHATSPITINVPGVVATIQGAIDIASAGNIVLVDEGIYYENINFKSKAITVASRFLLDGDTSHISNTIIDGSQPSNPDSGSAVYFVSGEDTNSVLCGFTITGGNGTPLELLTNSGSGNGENMVMKCRSWKDGAREIMMLYRTGGGIFCTDVTGVKLKNNRIIRNQVSGNNAAGGGMAFYSDSSILILEDNHFLDNNVTGVNNAASGGIDIIVGENSYVRISGNFFERDTVRSQGAVASGALWVSGASESTLASGIVKNNVFRENTTESTEYQSLGGAVMCLWTTGMEFRDNLFENNASISRSSIYHAQAGGVFIEDTGANGYGSKLVVGNTFIGNRAYSQNAPGRGGAIALWNTTAILSGNYFYQNKAQHNAQGGAIRIYQSSFLIENNIFSENTSQLLGGANYGLGGAIHVSGNPQSGGEMTIMNNTFVNNSASSHGGGIYAEDSIKVINSIFWGNTPDQLSGYITASYCDVQDGWTGPGTDNIDSDPLFADTIEYKLFPSSPCIGAGIDSIEIGGLWYHAPPTDKGGYPRPMPAGTMPDMGASEDQIVGLNEIHQNIPLMYSLSQNYPNPFNPTTNIEFSIPKSEFVTLKVYNILGEEVVTLVSERLNAGSYKYDWSRTAGMASGVYLYRIQAGNYVESRKMVLLR